MVKEKKVFYRTFGNGYPVILLHGFGEMGHVWQNQWEFLQSNYKLIIPDLPGSGGSEIQADMSMSGMADTIHDLLESENLIPPKKKFILIGHSMGGYIALAFAEKYSDRLDGLGLFHSSAKADDEEKKKTRQKGIEFIKQHGAESFLKNTIPKLFSPDSNDNNPKLVEDFLKSINNLSAESLVSYYEAMMARPDRTSILKKSTYPVLFVIGQHDTTVPMEDTLKQTHLPDHSSIHILKNSAHMGMLEEPDEANQILKKFLQDTKPEI